jgi:UDP-2-acetamido-2,6-beta-L-arabino-hexul-4-ose reductase
LTVNCLNKEQLKATETATLAFKQAQIVVNCAGVNRGSEEEVIEGNICIGESISTMLLASGTSIVSKKLINLNSTHIDRTSGYGLSKKQASKTMESACQKGGWFYFDLILPGVFGEFGRPNYNSVVSTFCNNICSGLNFEVNQEGSVEIIHAQSVSRIIRKIIESTDKNTDTCQSIRVEGERISIPDLSKKLTGMYATYISGIFPSFVTALDVDLFNTLRSYLKPSWQPFIPKIHTDERGSLVEIAKGGAGGQTFFSTTNPAFTRGNHFHTRKVERFLVIEGQAQISIRKIWSDEVHTINVEGAVPTYIDIPTFHTHNITNVGNIPLKTVFWTNEAYDPNNSDTFAEKV